MSRQFHFPNPQTTEPRERRAQRILEVIPALMTWTTLIGMVVFSFIAPTWMAVAIIAFDLYWIHRTVFIAYYSVKAYLQLQRGQRIDWYERCTRVGDPDDYARDIAKRIVETTTALRGAGLRRRRQLRAARKEDQKLLATLRSWIRR